MLSSRFLSVNMNLRCESIFDSVIYLGDLKECDGTHSERSAWKEDYQQDLVSNKNSTFTDKLGIQLPFCPKRQ